MSKKGLGYAPEQLPFLLVRDAPYVPTVMLADKDTDDAQPVDFPPGAKVRITWEADNVPPIVWEATVSGAFASWNVPKEKVNEVLDARPRRRGRVWYDDVVLSQGPIDPQ